MSCKVVFTDTAKADLRDIAVYLAELSRDKVRRVEPEPVFAGLFPPIRR